jgi:ribosomal protein L44E
MEEELKPMPDILGMSLYESVEMREYTYNQLFQLVTYTNDYITEDSISSLDSYCLKCKKDTTFHSRNSNSETLNSIYNEIRRLTDTKRGYLDFDNTAFHKHLEEIEVFTRSFYCPRASKDKTHDIVIVLRAHERKITKIGQYPQLADLENTQLKKYKDLDKEIYHELNRAAGLNSHGIGVGSFVYLRRIIEKYIVSPEIEKLLKDKILTAEQVNTADFKGKVTLAKDYLPSVLVDNPRVYSILSKGIHTLSEQDCLEIFNPLLTAIELILDERLEKVERDKKIAKMQSELSRITK